MGKAESTAPEPAPDPSGELTRLLASARRDAQAGQLLEAAATYQKILALRPDYPEANHFLGNVLATQGRFDEAADHYRRALAVRPDVAELHSDLGGVLLHQGKVDDAIACLKQALALSPNLAAAHNNLGNALAGLDQLDAAVAHLARAIALRPNWASVHGFLGSILLRQRKLEPAAAHLRQAIALRPDQAEPYTNLAIVQTHQGRFEDAEGSFRQAIALEPDLVEAHHDRAQLITFRPGSAELALLESLAEEPARLPPDRMIYVHFALGKALEDVRDYPRAFQQFLRANALKRQEICFDETATRREFESVPKTFNADLLSRYRGLGDPSPTPIFVVGMPRSGSTMVEQILASHPQIHAAGELDNIGRIAQAAMFSVDLSDAEQINAGAALREIGRAYLASLPAVAADKTRIVDKAPGNFLNLGLIHLILPNARIIHTTRSAADTCVSCFTKLFADGQEFSYDLAELGRYYCRYQQLMAYWRSVLPRGAMLDVAYEEVVDDLEGQARRLIEYCGLPWDAACLSFHKTERPVSTASSVQVRQPLYRTSLARWRRYESYLEPLLAELNACGAR